MTRNVRTYDHFCLTARALECVGDRWSLLVIRDLRTGPKRFTDLMDRLGGITPKTLSQRLSELDGAGILTADREAGRREVWYQLTPAGADLGPVLDGLNWWGMRHAIPNGFRYCSSSFFPTKNFRCRCIPTTSKRCESDNPGEKPNAGM